MITWYIGIAGSLGAIARYMVSYVWIDNNLSGFPWGTLACNLIGTYVLCLIAFSSWYRGNEYIRHIVMIGFIGSFTTFSAFSAEVLNFLQHHQMIDAIAYLFLSICGGWLLAWLGYRTALLFSSKGAIHQ
jgi:CrcB protein